MAVYFSIVFALVLQLFMQAPLLARDLVPTDSNQVLAKLPPRLSVASASAPEQVLDAAQQAISLARSTADPRHLGHAQALLSPWWGRSDAPVRATVLQATVEQAQHRFAEARASLQRALKREPRQPQAWLTLATLDRLQGRYAQAAVACERVGESGQMLYASVCQMELNSLQGRHAQARAGFLHLLGQHADPATQAWIHSLLGEAQVRAGRPAQAERHFLISLQLAPDVYTGLALADLFLTAKQPQRALDVLQAMPRSDAVLMRLALAHRQRNDAQWQRELSELQQRFADSRQRGDDQSLHARELAWTALQLETDASAAQRHALVNIQLQKEPIDWWLALRSTQAVADAPTWQKLRHELNRSGLKDARIDLLLAGWNP